MIATSSAFHAAIRADEPQMPLFIFDNGAFMTSRDVESAGISFSENVMSEEDFVPGSCCASTLSFQVLNESGAWSNFQYGEFQALLGVRTYVEKTDYNKSCYILVDNNRIEGSEEAPYLKFNSTTVTGTTEPVKALFLFNTRLFVFTDSGYDAYNYTQSRITKTTFSLYDAPIIYNSKRWKLLHQGFVYLHRLPHITTGLDAMNDFVVFNPTSIEAYEMIPLGVFTAEKPVYSSRKNISIDAFDKLVKFDVNYKSADFHYPTTVFGLLQQVCTVAGVSRANTSITNGSIEIPKEPDFEGDTLRDVLGYIAEISGDFVRVNRYGQLELKWFGANPIVLNPHDYSECDVGYYNAAGVDQLVIRELGADDVAVGTGSNIWYIQQNPIVKVITGGG